MHPSVCGSVERSFARLAAMRHHLPRKSLQGPRGGGLAPTATRSECHRQPAVCGYPRARDGGRRKSCGRPDRLGNCSSAGHKRCRGAMAEPLIHIVIVDPNRVRAALTDRRAAHSVRFVTGHGRHGGLPRWDWPSVCRRLRHDMVRFVQVVRSQIRGRGDARGRIGLAASLRREGRSSPLRNRKPILWRPPGSAGEISAMPDAVSPKPVIPADRQPFDLPAQVKSFGENWRR